MLNPHLFNLLFYITSGSHVMPSGHIRQYILPNTMSSGHREAIVRPSQQHRMQNYQFLCLRECFGYNREPFMCPSCVHRVNIGRLRVYVGSILAFNQIREENRAKLKISYSCGHRVSKSARYDATLKLSLYCSDCPKSWSFLSFVFLFKHNYGTQRQSPALQIHKISSSTEKSKLST